MALWTVIFIGIIGGIAVGVQATIAGEMGQRIGGSSSSLVIHITGLIFSIMYLIYRKGENIQNWQSLSWYMFLAGALGLVLYLSINVSIPRLGGTYAIVLIIVGQLLAGLVIDHFGLLGVVVKQIDFTRILGVVLLITGAYFVSR